MITFFPTPYPNEWWYSVLCRFYVRYGRKSSELVFRELFSRNKCTDCGKLFPGTSIAEITAQLPSKTLYAKELLVNNTLMPYYLRMYSLESKKAILEDVSVGKPSGITYFTLEAPDGKQGPKFCPKCYHDDIKMYGEPYWHREHQIPLMSTCTKHRCRLIHIEKNFARLSETFLPLSMISCPAEFEEKEEPLDDVLVSYLELPFEIGPTTGYNNLTNKLYSQGFGINKIQKKHSLAAIKVCAACAERFGKEIAEQYFKKPSPAVLYRIDNWVLSAPERYALLQILAGLSTDELFGPPLEFEDPVEKKLKEKQGIAYSKKELAKSIGVSPAQLDTISRQYNITPVWKQIQKGEKEKRTEELRLYLTKTEKQLVCMAVELCGGGQMAVFSREVLLSRAREIINQAAEDTEQKTY